MTAGREPIARMQYREVSRRRAPSAAFISSVVLLTKRAYFAGPRQLPKTAGQLADDAVFPGSQLVEIDLDLAEFQTPRFRLAAFRDQLCDMEQGFRGNASPVKTHAAGILLGVDQGNIEAEVSGHECSGISAGAAADYGNVSRIFMLNHQITNSQHTSVFEKHEEGVFERLHHPVEEPGGIGAVNEPMII